MNKILSSEEILQIKKSATHNFDNAAIIQDSPLLYHTKKGDLIGSLRITGFDRHKNLMPESIIIFHERAYRVISVSYRDHCGEFEKKEDKIGTFFEMELDLLHDLTPPKTNEYNKKPIIKK